MNDIVSFLIKLATDRKEMERFLKDPEAIVNEVAGLTADDKHAIVSGDEKEVRRILGDACRFPSNIYGNIYGPNIYMKKAAAKRSKGTKLVKAAAVKGAVSVAKKLLKRAARKRTSKR